MIILYLLSSFVLAWALYKLNQIKNKLNYWKNKGVPQLNPSLLYGDFKDAALQKKSTFEQSADIYFECKKNGLKHAGVYAGTQPKWLVIHPELIKSVLVTDFQHFSAHFPKISDTLLLNNLFHMSGDSWKDMRRKLTPTFTSGKMKMMFEILLQKTNGLDSLIEEMAKTGQPTEIKQLIARYTTDIIGSVGFGIEAGSLKDINSQFYQSGQIMFQKLKNRSKPSAMDLIKRVLGWPKKSALPDLSDCEDFFRKVVNDTVEYRETNNILRKDFLQLMIQLRNKGTITDLVNEQDVFKNSGDQETMSMEDLAGQCLLFFTAGFETSSTTMSYALLELTQNQDVQDKLRHEIRHVLAKHNGIITYDSLADMTYLDNVVSETLRKYPPLSNLPRLCTKAYKIPGTNATIDPYTMVDIPLLGLHNDPEYFPEPQKFKPERFSADNKDKIINYTYMPFGDGPRQCLGLRFGLMQTKTGIAALIDRYRFDLDQRTVYPPKFDPTSPVLAVDGGIWLIAKEAK